MRTTGPTGVSVVPIEPVNQRQPAVEPAIEAHGADNT